MDINTFIIEKKSEYFAVCNKILDFYYDSLDNKKVLKGLGDKEVLHINGLIEETELIRSKIRDNISLSVKRKRKINHELFGRLKKKLYLCKTDWNEKSSLQRKKVEKRFGG